LKLYPHDIAPITEQSIAIVLEHASAGFAVFGLQMRFFIHDDLWLKSVQVDPFQDLVVKAFGIDKE
jgi:hypothetical protein